MKAEDANKNPASNADHMWHVWINRQNENKGGDEFDHSPYEFKNVIQFLEYGHTQIADAFEGRLRKNHRQCSMQEPVSIKENVLRCACEGTDVTKCPMLLGIKEVFEEHKSRSSFYDIPVEHLYRTMAKTCAWHSLKVAMKMGNSGMGCDLSEGLLLDESDRMFWNNVYESMSDVDGEG